MTDLEKETKKQIEKNLIEREKNSDSEEYRTKIEKWCRKFGFEFDKFLEKAKCDFYFRTFFAKDPKKQNICEKVLVKYICSLDFVSDFQKLPNGGKNALYIDRVAVRKGSGYPHQKPVKSANFAWNIKNKCGEIIHFYVFHKYIEESGGAQDNQFNEIKKCIEVGRNGSQEVNRRIVFICDDVYFIGRKIKELKNLTSNWNWVFLESNELSNCLSKIHQK
ncbi:MAG: hypothetical protein MRERC_1c066 [Mycoplasmataceae bacterium RC_NB112A]|nr:MAG: hypothetical protein MRERC_1c066 [Mycoplasmataceae bacterium RC_NB112A]